MKPSLPLSDISPSFSVTDNSGTEIGVGRPLRALDLENTDLINTLTRARAKNQGMFLTQFEASFERTRKWMANKVKADDEVFFLIERENTLVAHYGLINKDDETAELDNSILIKNSVPKYFMVHTEHAILALSFGFLKKSQVIARVLNNNFSCIAMHQAAGLRMQSEQPLIVNSSKKEEKVLEILQEKTATKNHTLHLLQLSLKAADYWLIREKMGYLPVDYDDSDLL